MRKKAKGIAAVLTATASCLAVAAGTAGTADAAPQPKDSQSKLVLAVGPTGFTGTMIPERVVTLECGPAGPASDHPNALKACDDLERVDGAFQSLVGLNQSGACTQQYDPATVTIDGYWKGSRVSFEHTFPNKCVKDRNASFLFRF
ncbi:SSI family serine proteinase inhibitor [Streptomyces iconiensis]|uniref:SSI family serine proteinase inhibitor n=1 Tax=Streptomyces iconiensis TaxID=1384038 RepID=A0ABT7A5H6_9ACTN|nr:SSI family serine proteinase inhibitor [Streptomyces iconiensis]MDJ1136091.1 SSI family serine proteinase inhibitor [Streptomyces iconiensis]